MSERIGGEIPFVSAADNRVTLVVNAPHEKAHRFAPQLRKIVDVVELVVLKNSKQKLIA